uniref:WW domain-containing protein n=1 Tax=Panagrolaimus sp. PS1159 TaxID=55785 RepID=A0AC35GM56_9BILA
MPSQNRPENVLLKSTIPGYGENTYCGVISLPPTLKRDKNVVSGGYGIFFHRVIGKFYYTKSTNEPTWNRPNEVLLDDER